VYTQCSKCETVFKISAEVLRAAGGQVRCGNCGEVFNALARLAEESTAFAIGESALDLEVRADNILESVETGQVQATPPDDEEFAPPGVEIAQLQVIDWTLEEDPDQEDPDQDDQAQPPTDLQDSDDADAERSLEFTLPPGELDRIFVESKKRMLQLEPQPAPPLVPHSEPEPVLPRSAPALVPHPELESVPPRSAAPLVPHPELESVPPRSAAPLVPHPELESVPPRSAAPLVPPRSAPPPAVEPPSQNAAADDLSIRDRASGFEVPEDVRRDMLAGFEQHIRPPAGWLQDSARDRAQRRPLILWLSAAIISALLLTAQVVHHNREWFADRRSSGPFGAAVRALYGTALPAPANLSAYQLRQWGVTGDPDANGTLRLRASIMNTAALLQPYPLLRVTLADRFGKNIGRRDFEPSEYLGKPTAKLLAPGERVDATLAILDPGKDAEGFEIDVCLRGADRKMSCANDAAPQAKQ
jgi:predicted Zn finger-like uncharacterized protein